MKELSVAPANNEDEEPITVIGVKIKLIADPDAEDDDAAPGALAFDTDDDIGATIFEFIVGEERAEPVQLPDVKGGAEGDRTYSTSALPAGLEFDEDELTISGVPTAVTEETTVTYTVIDSDGASVATTLKLKVDEAPPTTVDVETVTLSQSSVRENGELTAILITAELAEAAEKEETVTFTIGAGDPAATRDVDYNADFDPPSSSQVKIVVGEKKASTTLKLTPYDNEDDDGDRLVKVTAKASGEGEPGSADITIADDETPSTSITLSADTQTVNEDAGTTPVTITATLNGQVVEEDVVVIITIDPSSTADRDGVDYECGVGGDAFDSER